MNFTNVDNYARGCGSLDGQWRFEKSKEPNGEKNKLYIGAPGYDGSPACEANKYAPEGEGLADIVSMFADDHDEWADTFFDAWEKMQLNGYKTEEISCLTMATYWQEFIPPRFLSLTASTMCQEWVKNETNCSVLCLQFCVV